MRIRDWSSDVCSCDLVYAESDVDSGRYYFFDESAKKLRQIAIERPQLAGVPLGKMTSVSYPAADGTTIPAYLTLPPGSDGKNLQAIVMPHGGPASRDRKSTRLNSSH